MKTGVFLARMQPLHNAHLLMIKKALNECDRVAVCLGSANKEDMLRNPFSLEFRKSMLMEALQDEIEDFSEERVLVFEVPDWSMESDHDSKHVWGEYLYYNIVSRIKQKKFTFYYGDEPEIMLSWFEDLKPRDNLDFVFVDRASELSGLSATKIREAIIKEDVRYLLEYCPRSVTSRMGELKSIWERVVKNPLPDKSME